MLFRTTSYDAKHDRSMVRLNWEKWRVERRWFWCVPPWPDPNTPSQSWRIRIVFHEHEPHSWAKNNGDPGAASGFFCWILRMWELLSSWRAVAVSSHNLDLGKSSALAGEMSKQNSHHRARHVSSDSGVCVVDLFKGRCFNCYVFCFFFFWVDPGLQ